jgi:hypothetical protein
VVDTNIKNKKNKNINDMFLSNINFFDTPAHITASSIMMRGNVSAVVIAKALTNGKLNKNKNTSLLNITFIY